MRVVSFRRNLPAGVEWVFHNWVKDCAQMSKPELEFWSR